ncbi:Uncharacterized conserved protein [Dermatophilus congolensis]|uniref:SURF1-like protein n=1 Tax=Dermatophilus congolensis TaxID=1863 RepID=A0A239VDK3_9MICO|nr:SURF1 family protein [Dermatophilus congolensis]SNV19544.1 Uncharacterized conserved protein [Dermatophilus congolensis]
MLRTALKPKWLGLLLLVLLVVVSFTWLGFWQLDVAQAKQQREAAEYARSQPYAPINSLLPPHHPLTQQLVGRKVTATGAYVPEHQLIVTPRLNNGQAGAWVMTPLNTGDAYVPVVRGWVRDPAHVQPPPTGTVTVTGVLAPPESAPSEPTLLPSGQVATIDLAHLVNTWNTQTYSAFVITATETTPGPDGKATPITSWRPETIPAPQPDTGGIQWRNLAYALQWWFFAAFAVYMWIRMVRDDAATDAAIARGETATTAPIDPWKDTPTGEKP